MDGQDASSWSSTPHPTGRHSELLLPWSFHGRVKKSSFATLRIEAGAFLRGGWNRQRQAWRQQRERHLDPQFESSDRKFVTIEELPEIYYVWNDLTEMVFHHAQTTLNRHIQVTMREYRGRVV